MTNVVKFNGYTTVDIEPDSVLDGAKGSLSTVIVIGHNKHDDTSYIAASTADKKRILWMIEQFKFKLFNGDFD
jgi:hypothetical protein